MPKLEESLLLIRKLIPTCVTHCSWQSQGWCPLLPLQCLAHKTAHLDTCIRLRAAAPRGAVPKPGRPRAVPPRQRGSPIPWHWGQVRQHFGHLLLRHLVEASIVREGDNPSLVLAPSSWKRHKDSLAVRRAKQSPAGQNTPCHGRGASHITTTAKQSQICLWVQAQPTAAGARNKCAQEQVFPLFTGCTLHRTAK